MDRLAAMEVFTEVARNESFAGAARTLRMSTSAVSRLVSALEEHLGVRLLQRTTRKVSLTDPGRAYFERCQALLEELSEIEQTMGEQTGAVRGRVRMTAGVSFAQEQLGRILPEFASSHPEVSIELVLTDQHLDLVADRFDLAIRIGDLQDSSLIARKLAPARHVACASPAYLQRRGTPRSPSDLERFDLVVDTNQPTRWWFTKKKREVTVAARGRYQVNSAHAARDAALAGLGIAYLPTFVGGSDLQAGRLVPLFESWSATELGVYAVYPHARHLSAAVRSLVDFLVDRLGPEPPWDGLKTDS